MAKKNSQPVSDEVEVIAPDVQESTSKEASTKSSKKTAKSEKGQNSDKKANKDKSSQEPNKDKSKDKSKTKKKEKRSLKKKASEVISELKKVSKPSFGTVVKNTCVVIAVVAICTLLLFGMDKLFSLIYDLLLP